VPEKFSVYITQSAQNDLEHIFFYIAADNINNAKKFILEQEERINSLDTFPERCPYIQENNYFGTNYRHLVHKKYRAVYKIVGESVYILRVVHGAKLFDL